MTTKGTTEKKNAENIIIKSKDSPAIHRENWKKHLEHSERYEARY
jgi:hypothetical protein